MSFTLVKNELILTITKDKLACILSIQKVKFDAKVLHFFELCKSWHHFFTLKMHYFAKIKTLECIILQNTTFQNALFDNPNWNNGQRGGTIFGLSQRRCGRGVADLWSDCGSTI